MPGPAVYVVAVVSAVAVGYVLKEFLYDPHIAPIIHNWGEQQRAHRNSQRRPHSPVPAGPGYGSHGSPPPKNSRAHPNSQRRPHSPAPAAPGYGSHSSPAPKNRNPSSIELDVVVANEVDEWKTSGNMRHRQANSGLDDGIPNEVREFPLLSPSTPLARSPPQTLRPPLNDTAPTHLSPSLASPVSLSIPNLASFATDVDYTASSADVTPLVQNGLLRSNLTSPQLTATSPFSDVFELAQSQTSEVGVARAGPGLDEEFLSVPSSMSSVTATDDEDDNDSLGSGEGWHDIRNEHLRS